MAACTGIRVLEVAEGFGAASLCGQLFSGLDAQVVKLESRDGDILRKASPLAPDGTAYLFHLANAGKKSVVLPQERDAARTQWLEFVEWADVLLLQDRAGASLSEFGFDPEAFCDRWPTKVLCSISTFGNKSARENWLGNELIAEAMAGLIACTGYPERPPVRSGVPYALHVTSLFAFGGIMAALWEQSRSGRGQCIDLGVMDCLVALLGNFIPSYFLKGGSPKRVGNRHTTAAPWNLYPTSDRYIVICTGSGGGWWKKIAKVIGRPDLAEDPRYNEDAKRVERVDEVDRLITDWTHRHTTQLVIGQMISIGIPASEVVPVETVLCDPHYGETRAMLASATVERSGGRASIPLVGLPLKVGAWKPRSEAGPVLGNAGACDLVTSATTRRSRTDDRVGRAALDGIRVLEFGARTSVPLAGRLLADMGADVIKIEPPKGEGHRSAGQMIGGSSYLFHINNAGKRSVVVDPKDPRGRELILELAAQADVWIENLAPGTLDSMGLGYGSLSAVNSRIIYASCSGFGHRSNYGKKRALDAVVQAASGIMHLTGYPDHLPVKIGLSAVDLGVAVGLVGAVLGALRERCSSGAGTHIDLAMADIGVWMTQSVWPQIFSGAGNPARLGNRSASACPHNVFTTKDGFIAIGIDTDHQWRTFAHLLGDAELANDTSLSTLEGRVRNVERIEKAVIAWLADKPAEEAAAICQATKVPAAPVRNLADIVKDPDVIGRGLIVEVKHPIAGRMKLLGNPLRLSRTPAAVSSCAPMLGEHTSEILSSWLALSTERIEALHSAGVVISYRRTA